MTETTMIDKPSVQSLLLELKVNGNPLGPATGFVVERAGRAYLPSSTARVDSASL